MRDDKGGVRQATRPPEIWRFGQKNEMISEGTVAAEKCPGAGRIPSQPHQILIAKLRDDGVDFLG